MNRTTLLQKISDLKLNPRHYIVIGSGTMCALNIRDAQDIDLVVAKPIFDELIQSSKWLQKLKENELCLCWDVYEIAEHWGGLPKKLKLADLKKTEQLIDNVPFANLHVLQGWKTQKARPKDLVDIKLIDEYLANNN